MAERSLLEQMRQDVQRALNNPREQRRWVMIVDIRKCVGCHACTVACKAENMTPPGVDYRIVREAEDGVYPNVQHYFMPTLCMQCENPPCVKACKDGSITKGKDGVVRIDYVKNTGDPGPVKACPYNAMSIDNGDYYTNDTPQQEAYENADTFEYGIKSGRKGKIHKNRKCHYCMHRVEVGMLPACVSTCIGAANYFGDLNDADSVVAKVAKDKNIYIFRAEQKTGPTTRYMSDNPQSCAKCHE